MTQYWTDDVSGIVIGEQLRPYHFYTLPKQSLDGSISVIAKNWFENDAQAIEWFRNKYPDQYKAGAEMRCYDQL